MKLIHRTNRDTTEKNGGFTLIETLIAITIISLIGVSVFTITSDISRFSTKIKELNRWNRELINLERVLRVSIGNVRIPFWEGEVELTDEDGVMAIPYWKGNADLFLELKIKDSFFTITTPEGSKVFKGYESVNFGLLKESSFRVIGLNIRVKKEKRDGVEFQCTFGAIGREVFNGE